MSAGRAAMWLISGMIVAAMLAVLIGPGLDGFPRGWLGLAVAGAFASIAFALGFYE
jgi:hypothetical protein